MLTANEILEWNEAGVPAAARPLLDVDGLAKTFTVKAAGWRTQVWRPWQRTSPANPSTGPSSNKLPGHKSPIHPPAPVKALDNITFSLLPGQSLAIIGAAGAGKSTLARLIMGQLAPDAGSATRSCQIQLMPQDGAAFFPARQTIGNAIIAAFAPQRLTPDAARQQAHQLLERVGLAPDLFERETMTRLSRGQRQRMGLALALVGEPQVLILDEPTAGLGAVAAAPLIELMQDLRVERGLSYLVLTRDLEVAKALASAVLTLMDGRLVDGSNASTTATA
jgi:peptide/nickel transport system ATP-binding protein